ncbi:glycosyltransferase family 4 protein [Polynucleobacter paneuropaeus]|nr:glycosyltransferase family 4 protein [Polynucleobacter paneuropaeus]
MPDKNKKIFILAASPLTIQFFFRSHIKLLAKEYDVYLAFNKCSDDYVLPLNLPVTQIQLDIFRKVSILADIKCFFQLLSLCKKHRFDIVVTLVPKAGFLGIVTAWLAGVSVRIHIFQGEVWSSYRGILRVIYKYADTLTALFATHILAVSRSERSFLECSGVVDPCKIQVLGAGSIGGVDLKRFNPSAHSNERTRAELGIPAEAFVIIFVGRVVRDKGIFELVEAFNLLSMQYSNIHLLIVGPDEEGLAPLLFDSSNQNPGKVTVIGYTHNPEKYLSIANLLCLPSHREGFGMVVLEAAAMGIPAIGSRIYGISDAILDKETGLLFQKGNVKALVDVIKKLIDDPNLLQSLGVAAKLNVQNHFDADMVVKQYVDFIRKVDK